MAGLAYFRPPGFNFDNFERNETLLKKGYLPPKTLTTGTTICGARFKDGVVFAADQRATMGSIVDTPNCNKIHVLGRNIVACGAGTSGDLDALERMIIAHIELHRLNSGKEVPICVAISKIKQHLFRYQGHLGCALVLGGVDKFGFHLAQIHPHGSSEMLSYTSMGSGSLAAMAFLETYYKPDMNLEEAKQLTRNAILAGVENDLASGNGISICVVTKDGMDLNRDYEIPPASIRPPIQGNYKIPCGATTVLGSVVKYEEIESSERQLDPERFMETH